MHHTLSFNMVLLILAFVCFVLGAIPIPARVNLISLGLAFWILTIICG